MVAYLDETGSRHLVRKIYDRIYPVGSIYFTVSSTSPSKLFGGSWQRYAQGRVMVSASDTDSDFTLGKTGGEKRQPVDLTKLYALWANRGTDFIAGIETMPNNTVWRATVKSQTVNHYPTSDVSNAGVRVILPENDNHRTVSAIQPYAAVYVWRRIA